MKPTTQFGQAVDALAAWLASGHFVPMSPQGFHVDGTHVIYAPPPATTSRLLIAPEVATLQQPPSANTQLFEAAMCLRAWWEQATSLETRMLRVTRASTIDEAWRQFDASHHIELPHPRRRDYPGLGSVRRLLRAMTRRDLSARTVPADGLRALVHALPGASLPNPSAIHRTQPANGSM